MSTIMRFIIAGDDRASSSFNRFAKSVEKINRDMAANQATMSTHAKVLHKLAKSAQAAGKMVSRAGKNAAIGAAGFTGLSALTAMASPLAAATVALGGFTALALPTLAKVEKALTTTGKAGQKAWKELDPTQRGIAKNIRGLEGVFKSLAKSFEPVVGTVLASAVKLAKAFLPALKPLAGAGAKVLEDFITPLTKWVRSKSFGQFIASFSSFAVQVGKLIGPQMVTLLAELTQLFVKLLPAGLSLLRSLVRAFVSLVGSLTPVVVPLANITASLVTWLKTNKLLIPSLVAVGVALAVASDGILPIIGGIAMAVAGLVHMWKTSTKFRMVVTTVFTDVGNAVLAFTGLALRGLQMFADSVLSAFGVIINGAAKALGWMPGIGPKLKTAAAAFNGFRTSVDNVFNSAESKVAGWRNQLSKLPKTVKLNGEISGLTSKLATAEKALRNPNLTKTRKARVKADVSSALANIARLKTQLAHLNGMTSVVYVSYVANGKPYDVPHHRPTGRAFGGPFHARQWLMVGERGPELVRFHSPGHVYNNEQTKQMMRPGVNGPLVNIQEAHFHDEADLSLLLHKVDFAVVSAGLGG